MAEQQNVYRSHSRWSDPGKHTPWLREVPPTTGAIVRHLPGLVMHCGEARLLGLAVPERALQDVEVRRAERLLDLVLSRDGRPATDPRDPAARFFGVCAHFALLATAVLRTHGVPARVRVGFARYFVPEAWEDHWVTEYWDGAGWRLLDAQLHESMRSVLGIAFPPWDVPREQFHDASTAWQRLRAGDLDPGRVGVSSVGLTGAWFAAQSVLRDVAALNKEEMLPWDTWGPGREVGVHAPEVPLHLAETLDAVSRLVAGSPNADLAARVYRDLPRLRRTPAIFSLAFPRGWPDGVPTELTL